MVTSISGWRRAGMAGLGVALALSSTALGASNAQAAPSSADNTVAPVRGALANSTANALGVLSYTEDTAGQFFAAGTTTIVMLKLSDHALFSAGVKPTITAPVGYAVTAVATADPALDSYNFAVTAPATAVKAVITVRGLRADVDNAAKFGPITVSSTPGDPNVALQVIYGDRLGGKDRYETAASLFSVGADEDVFVDPSSVVLASGEGYADALSANYLAGELGTGTLLTRSGSLSPVTQEVISDYDVNTVYIAGGVGAVSKAVETKLRGLHVGGNPKAPKLQVIRLGGKDRYATNQLINDYAEDGFPDNPDTALLASGRGFADALALGPVAYAENFPIILTPGDTLGVSATQQLKDRDPDHVVLAGGTASISAAVQDDLRKTYGDAPRYGGADRTATAASVANWASRDSSFSADFDSSAVSIANGLGYADALAMGPLAGADGQVVLLSKNRNDLGVGTQSYLADRAPATDIAYILLIGLTGSTSDVLGNRAANAVGASPTGAAASSAVARHRPAWLNR